MSIPHLEFGAPWVLLLLLFLPLWWGWRRRRRPAAIVFSRVSVLAAGPRAGRAIARSLVVGGRRCGDVGRADGDPIQIGKEFRGHADERRVQIGENAAEPAAVGRGVRAPVLL